MHRATSGTHSGGVGRIDGHKTNTVLLCLTFDPVEDLSVGPRRNGFTETLSPVLLLSGLQPPETLDAQNGQPAPRQAVDGPVDVVLAFLTCLPSVLASRFPSPDLISDSLEPGAIVVAIRVRKQFVDADINAQALARFLGGSFRNVYPKDQMVVSQSTPLRKSCTGFGHPLVEDLCLLGGDSDPVAFAQTRKVDHQIKRTMSVLNKNHAATKYGSPVKDRHGTGPFLGRVLCGPDNAKGMSHCLVPKGEGTSGFVGREPFPCLGVQAARHLPERSDVEVDHPPVFSNEVLKAPAFALGGEFQCNPYSASHTTSLIMAV